MDLFGADIDSFLQEDELNKNIREEDVENADGQEHEGDEKQIDENGEPIKVEPKKRSVRKPQVWTQIQFDDCNTIIIYPFFLTFSCV